MDNLFHSLFEAGFFNTVIDKLFQGNHYDSDIDCERLVRTWLNLSANILVPEKIMNNMLQIRKTTHQNDLKILLSIIRNDTSYEKSLQKFFKGVSIPPSLGINLLRILDTENSHK